MSDERITLRTAFLAGIDDEIERRRHAALVVGDESRRWVTQTLDGMAARMRAAPGWKEPTPAQQRRSVRWVEAWLLQRGFLKAGC